ncbi:hypothetical protein THAOC_22848, partial [Thalassiosira oceanica]
MSEKVSSTYIRSGLTRRVLKQLHVDRERTSDAESQAIRRESSKKHASGARASQPRSRVASPPQARAAV